MAMPMTSHPSCSTGCRMSLIRLPFDLLEQQTDHVFGFFEAFLHVLTKTDDRILEVIAAHEIIVHFGVQALHISPQRLDRVPDDLHPPASEDASTGKANVDKGLGFHVRHPLNWVANDYDAGAAGFISTTPSASICLTGCAVTSTGVVMHSGSITATAKATDVASAR